MALGLTLTACGTALPIMKPPPPPIVTTHFTALVDGIDVRAEVLRIPEGGHGRPRLLGYTPFTKALPAGPLKVEFRSLYFEPVEQEVTLAPPAATVAHVLNR
jgi:hypothetical protein